MLLEILVSEAWDNIWIVQAWIFFAEPQAIEKLEDEYF